LVGFREKGEGFLGGEGFEQGRGRTDVYCTGGRRGVIVCLFSSLLITGAEQQLKNRGPWPGIDAVVSRKHQQRVGGVLA